MAQSNGPLEIIQTGVTNRNPPGAFCLARPRLVRRQEQLQIANCNLQFGVRPANRVGTTRVGCSTVSWTDLRDRTLAAGRRRSPLPPPVADGQPLAELPAPPRLNCLVAGVWQRS